MASTNPNLAYNWLVLPHNSVSPADYSADTFDATGQGSAKPIMGVYCTTAGSATLVNAQGDTGVFTGLLAGVIYPLCPVRQTAGDARLIALYSK
jgi:hypothetical protein